MRHWQLAVIGVALAGLIGACAHTGPRVLAPEKPDLSPLAQVDQTPPTSTTFSTRRAVRPQRTTSNARLAIGGVGRQDPNGSASSNAVMLATVRSAKRQGNRNGKRGVPSMLNMNMLVKSSGLMANPKYSSPKKKGHPGMLNMNMLIKSGLMSKLTSGKKKKGNPAMLNINMVIKAGWMHTPRMTEPCRSRRPQMMRSARRQKAPRLSRPRLGRPGVVVTRVVGGGRCMGRDCSR